jgi:proline iminopeptidase
MRVCVHDTVLYVDVDGSELVVDADGLRRRPTLLVLHGGPGFDQGYLRPGLGPLAADAQLVFVDLRGQGRSAPAPVETCTLEQIADDVAALCGELGIERPVVFGHSAGGFVALQLALRHPGLASGLILANTTPTLAPLDDDDPPPSLAERAGEEAATVARRLFGGDFSPETGEAFGRLVAPHYAGPEHLDVAGPLFALTGFNPDVASHFFNRLAPQYDVRPRLGEIAVPTLVVTGSHDWVCAPIGSRVLAAGIPNSTLVVLAGAGHFSFSETPEPFLEAAREHLSRCATALDTS